MAPSDSKSKAPVQPLIIFANTVLRLVQMNRMSHEVWQGIALHTSPGFAERISSLAQLVRQAVLVDSGGDVVDRAGYDTRDATEKSFSRLDIERVLGDVVVEQALRQLRKAPTASWPGSLVEAKRKWPD